MQVIKVILLLLIFTAGCAVHKSKDYKVVVVSEWFEPKSNLFKYKCRSLDSKRYYTYGCDFDAFSKNDTIVFLK